MDVRLAIVIVWDLRTTSAISSQDSAIVIQRPTVENAISAKLDTGTSPIARPVTVTDMLLLATPRLANVFNVRTLPVATIVIAALRGTTVILCSEARLDVDHAVALTL